MKKQHEQSKRTFTRRYQRCKSVLARLIVLGLILKKPVLATRDARARALQQTKF